MTHNDTGDDSPSTEEGQSRALPYDPGRMLVRRKAVTAPLKPLEEAVKNRSPIMLVLGAIIILGMIVLAVVLAAGGEDDLDGIELSGIAASGVCTVVAPDDVNVRGGPGYEYERVWIMAGGESRQALDGFEETWLRLNSGWVAVSEITLQSSSACAQLPQSEDPIIFHDDIVVPEAIDALEWYEILTENFATSVNGWIESAGGAGVQISDGELVLSTVDNGAAVTTYPADAAGWGVLVDGYVTFRLEWAGTTSDDQQLGLIFRADGPTFYQLSLTRSGDLSLWRSDDNSLTQMAQTRVTGLEFTEPFTLGLLFNGEDMHVFLNGTVQLSASDSGIGEGTYRLALRGQNAAIRITRFEVKVPPEQVEGIIEG